MGKFCTLCTKEISEEAGSYELREFNKYGKVCTYFCSAEHLKEWLK